MIPSTNFFAKTSMNMNMKIITKPNDTAPTAPTTTTARRFFEEQDDLISEIFQFLDVKSVFRMCQTTKVIASCLRYDHIVHSVPPVVTLLDDTNNTNKNKNKNPAIILKKLMESFDIVHTDDKNRDNRISPPFPPSSLHSSTSSSNSLNAKQKPSPMRVLRLVHGQKCEKCFRALPPNVLATKADIVLPSLSFGEYCCTQCIFSTTTMMKQQRSQTITVQQDHNLRRRRSSIFVATAA